MNNQMKESNPAITVWIGLDWADQKHCLAVRPLGALQAQEVWVEQKPQALDEFFLHLRQQFPQGRIGVCLEQSRGPVIYALMKYDFVMLYPVNPRTLADFRRAFCVSGAKSDPTDAPLLEELGTKHHQRLWPLQPEEPTTRKLRLLVEGRRGLVDQKTALCNELTAVLKGYYPLALELVGEDLATPIAREFLKRWPNLDRLKAASAGRLRSFFYKHNSRSELRIIQRLQAVAAARPLTEDASVLEPLQLQALSLVRQLAAVQQSLAEYEQQIEASFEKLEDAWLFARLPGAGKVYAPRLAVAFGSRRANWPDPQSFQCRTGVAPVRKQSGGQKVVQFRYARPRFLHQTMVEYAQHSVRYSAWAALLYRHLKSKGKSTWAALRVIAFKWIRILWRCWTDRVAYDESRYLASLQKRGNPIYASLYANPVNNS